MASDYYHPYQQDRFWPVSLEDRLIGLLARFLGCAMLAVLAIVWICLISWSNDDPSLMHTTGGTPRNFFGFAGATFADILIQTFGLAIVFALMAPMIWAFELAFSQRVQGFRNKATYFPLAVVILAGALSSLPSLESWPLNHGFGGILGDTIYRLGANLCEAVLPGQGGAITGLILFAGGIAAAISSAGFEVFQLAHVTQQAILKRPSAGLTPPWMNQASRPDNQVFTNPTSQTPMFPHRAAENAFERVRERRGHMAAPAPTWPARAEPRVTEDRRDRVGPVMPSPVAPAQTSHAPVQPSPEYDQTAQLPRHSEALSRDLEFDETTDIASREIARRFAPASADIVRASGAKLPRAQSAFLTAFRSRDNGESYAKPALDLLRPAPARNYSAGQPPQVLRGQGRLLKDALAEFGIRGEVSDVKTGPFVTQYVFALDSKIKASRVISLGDDIARAMSVTGIRVVGAPDVNSLYFEVPNGQHRPVHLRELIESSAFRSSTAALPFALGRLVDGASLIVDLAQFQNVLVAGRMGEKDLIAHSGIVSLLYRFGPDRCRFLMIDSQAANLDIYNGLPHLAGPIVRDPKRGVALLKSVVVEMEERHKRMAKLSARRIDVFNNRVHNGRKRGEIIARTVQTGFDKATGHAIYEHQKIDVEPMPHLVVVIDELSDLMRAGGGEVEAAIERIAADGVAAGIHLVMATQHPSGAVISERVKRAVLTKVSLRVASRQESETVLGAPGADGLLADGDALIRSGQSRVVRGHCALISREELGEIVQSLRQNGRAQFDERFVSSGEKDRESSVAHPSAGPAQALYDRAIAISLRDGAITPAYLQRSLSVDFDTASDLIARLEADNIICAPDKSGVWRTLPRSA